MPAASRRSAEQPRGEQRRRGARLDAHEGEQRDRGRRQQRPRRNARAALPDRAEPGEEQHEPGDGGERAADVERPAIVAGLPGTQGRHQRQAGQREDGGDDERRAPARHVGEHAAERQAGDATAGARRRPPAQRPRSPRLIGAGDEQRQRRGDRERGRDAGGRARAPTSTAPDGATPHSSEPAAKAARPIVNSRRWPTRSPRRPAGSSRLAEQQRVDADHPLRPRRAHRRGRPRMSGSAMTAVLTLSTSTNCDTHRTPRPAAPRVRRRGCTATLATQGSYPHRRRPSAAWSGRTSRGSRSSSAAASRASTSAAISGSWAPTGPRRIRCSPFPATSATRRSRPTARTLAFTTRPAPTDDVEIAVALVDGGAVTAITDNAVFDSSPSWSPDGRRIAFERGPEGDDPGNDVWSMAADGTDQRQLTTSAGLDEGPAWSPGGSRIAFTSTRAGSSDIWTMAADGTDQRPLTAAPRARGARGRGTERGWVAKSLLPSPAGATARASNGGASTMPPARKPAKRRSKARAHRSPVPVAAAPARPRAAPPGPDRPRPGGRRRLPRLPALPALGGGRGRPGDRRRAHLGRSAASRGRRRWRSWPPASCSSCAPRCPRACGPSARARCACSAAACLGLAVGTLRPGAGRRRAGRRARRAPRPGHGRRRDAPVLRRRRAHPGHLPVLRRPAAAHRRDRRRRAARHRRAGGRDGAHAAPAAAPAPRPRARPRPDPAPAAARPRGRGGRHPPGDADAASSTARCAIPTSSRPPSPRPRCPRPRTPEPPSPSPSPLPEPPEPAAARARRGAAASSTSTRARSSSACPTPASSSARAPSRSSPTPRARRRPRRGWSRRSATSACRRRSSARWPARTSRATSCSSRPG